MLLTDLPRRVAQRTPEAPALRDKRRSLDYGGLVDAIARLAAGLLSLGLRRNDRVAIFLDSRIETVLASFAVSQAGGIFVLVNPILKGHQVRHILDDTAARFLITGSNRFDAIATDIGGSPFETLIIADEEEVYADLGSRQLLRFSALADSEPMPPGAAVHRVDNDIATIFYTSGSTGLPKGVVISHRNLVAGALSVSSYLGNQASDRIIALLPLGFDAGFSQITTAFAVGAEVVVHQYLSPNDAAKQCDRHGVTGITAVPPVFMQLLKADWSEEARRRLRYFANTGGHMPRPLLARLREAFPNARPFLMYGLTEAFRSTWLDPDEVDRRPDSIGKAIPNAEILVVRPDGELAKPGEIGELVHRGPLVSLGYWNQPELSAAKFRPVPGQPAGLPFPERAVFSGDSVRIDDEGFLYFVGRTDEMIKVGGARVSPDEVEDVLYGSGLVREAAVSGEPDAELGAHIVAVIAFEAKEGADVDALLAYCRKELPVFMVPARIIMLAELPRSPNGKIDRKGLKTAIADGSL